MESLHGKLDIRFLQIPTAFRPRYDPKLLVGYFSEEYHFFSEPGPINDHCLTTNFLVSTLTTPAFVKHSSLLPFLSQEISLNIDINKILPVKVSGVCPKSLSRSLILPQSCNVVNPGKMFHSNSVGSQLIVS